MLNEKKSAQRTLIYGAIMDVEPLTTETYDRNWLEAHWMPYTGNRDFKNKPRLIESAEGAYYFEKGGRKIFDGLSGLWCSGLGHCRLEITKAAVRQLCQLDYAPAFQFGHALSFELANKIVEIMPEGLDHVFFTGSGSEAADTALKMARAYWRSRGRASKTRLIGREKGYHGVNYGGMSVGGIAANRQPFGQGIEADHLPHTLVDKNAFTRGLPEAGAELADSLLQLINLHGAETIAAVIVEPFSGSAGVIVPPVGYLKRLREICNEHQILLIFDEVITAFGRSGAMTAAEVFGVTPDIMNVAKQITNGVQPLGAVIVKEEIYKSFMQSGGADYQIEFPHGYTYSAHPVSCAVGLTVLDLLQEENVLDRVKTLAPLLEQKVHGLKGSPHIVDIRNFGLAAGLSITSLPGQTGKRAYDIAMKCWEKGFYVRYSGDTIQLAPPFISTSSEIDLLINALGEAIRIVD